MTDIDPQEVRRNQIDKRLYSATGDLMYSLARFGDHLAQRESYKEVSGMDAVHFYVVQTYRWPPAQVRAMNHDDLRFLLSEELHGWTLPKAARV